MDYDINKEVVINSQHTRRKINITCVPELFVIVSFHIRKRLKKAHKTVDMYKVVLSNTTALQRFILFGTVR